MDTHHRDYTHLRNVYKAAFWEWRKYAAQDSKCLYEVLVKARKLYIERFGKDVLRSVSASQFAYKLLSTKYTQVKITVINRKDDNFIRRGYFGGAVDYYKASFVRGIKKLYHYDVTSLYPFAMKQLMPVSIKARVNQLDNLTDFFGFVECEVTCDKSKVKTPVLPYRINNKNIYGYGSWSGVYFSE